MIGFNLTEEQKEMQAFFRKFSQERVKAAAEKMDEEEKMDMDLIHEMQSLGMFGIPFSEEVGGAGLDVFNYVLLMEELSKVDASTSITVSVHTSLCASSIEEFATPEQKEKWLRPLADGSKIGCFGLTEPDAGSDVAGARTVAVKDGDEYVINGSKIFITNGGEADVYIIFAMTDKSKGTKGISAFIVEKDFPGFRIGTKEKKMGIRGSSTTELIFENCIVPKENLLGQEGKGFSIAMATLDGGRIGIAAQALGIAEGALEETIAYVKERKQFGRPIAKFQNTQFQIADMATKVEAARYLVYRAAIAKDTKKRFSVEAAMAKLYAAEVAMEVTTKAVQLFGGYGYTREYPVERMMRDAKITEIYEGTSEVQRMVISSNVIK